MRGIKVPQQDFALKVPGGPYARRGAYLRDTTVLVYKANESLSTQPIRNTFPQVYCTNL